MVVKRQIAKEWRADRERMYRGADVMDKAGQCQFHGTGAATNRFTRFEHEDGKLCARKGHGSCEAVRTRSDDDSIKIEFVFREEDPLIGQLIVGP